MTLSPSQRCDLLQCIAYLYVAEHYSEKSQNLEQDFSKPQKTRKYFQFVTMQVNLMKLSQISALIFNFPHDYLILLPF